MDLFGLTAKTVEGRAREAAVVKSVFVNCKGPISLRPCFLLGRPIIKYNRFPLYLRDKRVLVERAMVVTE